MESSTTLYNTNYSHHSQPCAVQVKFEGSEKVLAFLLGLEHMYYALKDVYIAFESCLRATPKCTKRLESLALMMCSP